MAFTKFGDGSYRFSLDSTEAAAIKADTGLAIQELQISGEPEFTAAAIDEEGETAAYAVGGTKRTFTASGYIVDKAKFEAVGNSFTFDGKFFIVTGAQRTVAARDYEKGQLTGESFAKVTSEVAEST